MTQSVVAYGDPHGEYENLFRELDKETPDAVIILGDMTKDSRIGEKVTPIDEELAPLLDAGIPTFWIPGNHDSDTEEQYDATFGALPEQNLHGKVRSIFGGKLRVGGLGGVFRGRIWFPHKGLNETPAYYSPEDLLEDLPKFQQWRNGIPLRHRASIFKSDADALKMAGADILVTHEAPSSMQYGFHGLDQLSEDMGAKVILHGHHHIGYEKDLPNGRRVRGVGLREAIRIRL
ncbi:metallophosphoesterase [Sulfitobacter sp. R18_1]|uniref:metallophosphoesterase family protein n=1 Tax=Sulfitobacter sp. R18_1 TaxID=2821104 RepID=UPI001ADCC576|nr:metallophosphoesterase [Sulfitobacter sp. R18_1]MBO9428339.1 metallophosphoesterase [Sulfitobacter sp. R18_1]